MTTPKTSLQKPKTRTLRRRVFATYWVIFWERLLVAFWPAFTLGLFTIAFLLWGGAVWLPQQIVILLGVGVAIWMLWLLIAGVQQIRLPTDAQIYRRLDDSVDGAPVSSLMDKLALGSDSAPSQELWDLHLQRMSVRAQQAVVPPAHVRLAGTDKYALRLFAILAVISGAVFANGTSFDRLGQGGGNGLVANIAPSFEAWAKPPLYTGLPTVYLTRVDEGEPISLAEGSVFLIRAYGDIGDVSIAENLSVAGNTTFPTSEGVLAEAQFVMAQAGKLKLSAAGGQTRSWDISLLSDLPPMIEVTGELTRDLQGAMQLPFRASDDYGVTGGALDITLDLARVDRRFGLALEPELVDNLTGELPLPFNARTSDFSGVVEEDFAKHVWAGLPVVVELSATDAGGNTGRIDPLSAELARKRFFDPLSAALVDVRRQLLWNRENAVRGIYLLRAVTYKPTDSFSRNKAFEMTREAIRDLEAYGDVALSDQTRSEVSELLWAAAILIEDGDVNDAKERLKRAQERLAEAMENGATEEEIAELMEELRQATQDYIKELGENAEESDSPSGGQQGEAVTQDEIQEMMDEIQRLMDEGRMDEAMELLQELQEMLENLQVNKQSGGEGGEGDPQEQDMQDMLEEQQELADDTFQELQEQFEQQQGTEEQQSQQGQQGQNGRQEGQSGQQQGQEQGEGQQQGDQQSGQQGQQQGEGQQQSEGQQQGQGQDGQSGEGQSGTGTSDLAGRQKALRDMLDRQRGQLPSDGGGAGDAARDALRDADREMGQAEESLRQGDFGQALDQQSDALQSLRRGIRAMREEGQQAQAGSEGETQDGGSSRTAGRDPLGRSNGGTQSGSTVDDNARNEGIDNAGRRKAYEDLLNDLKGRAQDRTRPEFELDYLERLLDRF
jgi:uncharacterized protein (TIGR02302 family)